MLTEIYIEALLVDEELADQVSDVGETDGPAAWVVDTLQRAVYFSISLRLFLPR
jgi:hypothetical protein